MKGAVIMKTKTAVKAGGGWESSTYQYHDGSPCRW
jgi:hypothetical protein